MPQAEYKCLKCNHQWLDEPGPTQCPICGHLYVKWLNYEDHWKDIDINNGTGKKTRDIRGKKSSCDQT
jgi:hypothetical protein